jgi:hypothetical protein
MTHIVNVTFSPCTLEKPAEPKSGRYKHTWKSWNLTSMMDAQLGTRVRVMETSFIQFMTTSRTGREIWLHEHCGNRQCAEHDLGMILIGEYKIPGTIYAKLNLKLEISEEGLLLRRPTLEMSSCCRSESGILLDGSEFRLPPITWESSNLSFSKDMMDNVRVQLAEEMKTFHHQYNLTVDGN